MSERRTFCPEDGHACYTPKGDEPEGFTCANRGLCASFEPKAIALRVPPKQTVGNTRGLKSLFGPGPNGLRDAQGNELLMERTPTGKWKLTVRGAWTLEFEQEPCFLANREGID